MEKSCYKILVSTINDDDIVLIMLAQEMKLTGKVINQGYCAIFELWLTQEDLTYISLRVPCLDVIIQPEPQNLNINLKFPI